MQLSSYALLVLSFVRICAVAQANKEGDPALHKEVAVFVTPMQSADSIAAASKHSNATLIFTASAFCQRGSGMVDVHRKGIIPGILVG